ncbi:Sec20-domain-containing protein [Piptocephalis cylindrospora]|uniref:Sec20-domain-containing protein n=1 Tax=Piptocephalis cylindrospora TaxID=1907219 RepID=A0A4P9Y8C4_9FUNG|nr:Sec20-domain-containing protein [Piptocephalis cylindrospora]|eukprot:RKP15285.1 Sec20-domain-containing protein [Piptocephalis cylindrospora]
MVAELRDAPVEGAIGSEKSQQELASSARALLQDASKRLIKCNALVEAVERPGERQVLLVRAQEQEGLLHRMRQDLRIALLEAKAASDAYFANKAKADLLASSSGQTGVRQRQTRASSSSSPHSSVMAAADDVTSALQRTVAMMSQEVEKSALNAETLDESTRLLRRTRDEYHGLGGVLRASRQALAQLERGDWTDRLLLLFGLVVFSSVVLYILSKRIWLPGFGWLLRSLWSMFWGSSN